MRNYTVNINIQVWTSVIFILFALLFNSTARASWQDGIFGKEKLAGPCHEKQFDVDANQFASLIDLETKAHTAKANRDYCLAASLYQRIMIETLDANTYSTAWYNRIESFFYQYDYENFYRDAFLFLKERIGSNFCEKVHYLLVKSVFEQSTEMRDIHNPWVQYGLGIHPEQFSAESEKNLLKFRSFLESHPKSYYLPEVHSFLEDVKIHFNTSYVKETRMMVLKREYVPAIVRYQFLINQGSDLPEYNVVFYELIQLLAEFSLAVTDEKILSDEKLARWLTISSHEVTLNKRRELQSSLQIQAQKVFQIMKQKLPSDPWTLRAEKDFRF